MILPIGTEDFGRVIGRKLDFVDKTLFIKELFDDKGTDVAVFARPRRFGKTLNLSMLHYFLAEKVNGVETKGLFKNLKIEKFGDEYMQHQGKYPVVSVTFKDIKESNYESAKLHLSKDLSVLYSSHIELLSSSKLSDQDKIDFEKILKKGASEIDLQASIKDLTRYMYLHHGQKPWLLIDEYDTPIQSGYMNGYYKEIVEFMRGMFGSVLKTNDYLEKGVITGILRVAKESLFSGVNNLEVYSLLRNEYSEHFGFTEIETDEILKKADLSTKSLEIKEWYNGYKVGETIIYNPWSIVNCLKQKGLIIPYWVNTSDNQLIKDLLKKSPLSFKKEFEELVNGGYVEKFIDENLVFQYLENNPSSVWSLLLMSGYLKPLSINQTYQGAYAKLAIPNKEVGNLYRQIVEQWLSNGHGLEWYNEFIESLLTGNVELFKDHLEKVITQITSYHDFAKEPEAFYQGLMLGFTVSLSESETYQIKSNRESGLGRFDIILIPKDINRLGIIIELKVKEENETLEKAAIRGLEQINEKKYTEELKQVGIKKSLKLGIGFSGKKFALIAEEEGL